MNRYQMRALARANRKRGQGYTRKKTMHSSTKTSEIPETAAFLKAADEFLKSVEELSKATEQLDVIDSTELQVVEADLEIVEQQDEFMIEKVEQDREDRFKDALVEISEFPDYSQVDATSSLDVEALLALNVREYIAEINSGAYDQHIDDLISLEKSGKSRVTILKALNSRK